MKMNMQCKRIFALHTRKQNEAKKQKKIRQDLIQGMRKMKKLWSCLAAAVILAGGTAAVSATVYASESEENGISYDQVASEEEKVKPQEVGVEGMVPVYGTDVADGIYEIQVESSSSMFRVEHAELTVKDGEMTAVLTMGGTGYLKLYMGTREEAAESKEGYIEYVENEDGKHTYTVPVEALDLPIDCAAFSRNREKWYDRQILFQAESLPEEAVLVELPDYETLRQEEKERRIEAMRREKEEAEVEQEPDQEPETGAQAAVKPAFIEMEDGEYAIEVELSGGSGRTTVNSPAGLIVKDGFAWARVQWSSSNYDYMIVGGEKYFPVNEEGYSTFEIPILTFNEPMAVIADTTAMSTPHEVDYVLTFYGDRIMSRDETPQAAAQKVVYMVLVIVAVCVLVSFMNKRKRNRKR